MIVKHDEPLPDHPVHIITGGTYNDPPKVLINDVNVGNFVTNVTITINAKGMTTATVTFVEPKITGNTTRP